MFGRLGNLMKQASQLQTQAAEMKQQLEDLRVTGGAGGVVDVVVNGYGGLIEITIAPEAVDPEAVDVLQCLIVAAVNDAQANAAEVQAAMAASLTQPFGLDLGAITGEGG